MAIVTFKGSSVSTNENESIIAAFESAGIDLPHNCQAGLCQACLMVVKSGNVPSQAQHNLTPQQLKQNLFLACQCYPDQDIEIALPSDDFYHDAILLSKKVISGDILQVSFKTDMPWRAGQYTTVWRNPTVGRTFSIASLSQDGFLEMHMRLRPDGAISAWLANDVNIGDHCKISDAKGSCFYHDDIHAPTVMACTGTGLAPLYGILKQAIAAGHQADIHLYAAAKDASELYLVDELNALSAKYKHIHYHPVVLEGASPKANLLQGDLCDIVSARHGDLSGHYVYLCGAPAMVNKLKKICFLQGAASNHILTDAFEVSSN